ncbi:hypothetical protein K1719_022437 [Acacia pycnantha]|nr:hypothetical protein K1719_022437 [Acacia pycnantha]
MEDPKISAPLIWKKDGVERIIVGKILSTRMYTRATLVSILQKAWNLQSGFDVLEIEGNAFIFKFEKDEEYNRILRGRPWSINGCLLSLLERSKYKSCEEFDFSRCLIWIQIHNVPLEALCLENAVMVGGYVGEVVLAEDPHYNNRYLRNFLRARVLIDLRKPLAYGFWLPKPDGGKTWISIRYEKLPNFCYNCGKLGHDNRNCKIERLMSVAKTSEPRFGPWLTTNACRSWEEVVSIISKDWVEAGYVRKKQEEAVCRGRSEGEQRAESESVDVEDDLFTIRTHKPSKGNLEHDSASDPVRKPPVEGSCSGDLHAKAELSKRGGGGGRG